MEGRNSLGGKKKIDILIYLQGLKIFNVKNRLSNYVKKTNDGGMQSTFFFHIKQIVSLAMYQN